MKFIRLSHMLFFIAMCVCPIAFANNNTLTFFENSHEKVHITADKIETKFIPDGYEVIFLGKVRGVQGPLSMTCDRVILYFKDKGTTRNAEPSKPSVHLGNLNKLRSATASGNVTIVHKKTMLA